MSNLDVALRLRLVNGLKAGAADAKRDLASVGTAAKDLGRARGLDGLSRDLDASSARAKRLERQLAGLRNARGFSGLGTALDEAAGGAGKVARFSRRIATDLEKAKGSATDLAGLMDRIAGASERAGRASRQLRHIQAREGRGGGGSAEAGGGAAKAEAMVGKAGAGLFRASAGMVGAGAAAAAAKHSVKTFADLETAAKELAITADKTDAEVAQVVERFRQLGPALGTSAKEMLESAQIFVAAGLDFDTSVAAVVPSVKAAKASFGQVADTAKAGVAAINNLGISADQLPEAFDRMAKAGKEGNVELKNLSRVLPSVAASGSKLGLTGLKGLTDISAALEILGKVTATPEEAANRLQNFFEKITADETVRALGKLSEKLGKTISLENEVKEGAKRGESAMAVMLRLAEELTGGDAFRINELFGDQQAREGVGALLKFKAEFNAMRERINADSKGMIDRDFERATSRLAADFEKLEAAWDRLAGRIGEGMAPSISAATREATGLLERLEKGDTILQRLMNRYGPTPDEAGKAQKEIGDRAESMDAWAEEKLPFLSGKKWNEWIDAKLGKTGTEAAHKREMDPYIRAAAEEAQIRARPDALREQIERREGVLARSRERAAGAPGMQRDMAERQVGASEAEIARLKGDLAQATQAVEALDRARKEELAAIAGLAAQVGAMARTGSFGLDGVKGDGSGGIGRNGFGLAGPKPQDLSGTAKATMDTYQQGLKAGLAQGEAAVAASVDRMKAMLNFTAAPTITPRISAPGGGGGASEGGGGSAKGKSASLGRGATHFNGPIHVHGVSNVASLERGIRREADRRVREARNDALHDTGNDFA